jgi:signal transduction histidine kinase
MLSGLYRQAFLIRSDLKYRRLRKTYAADFQTDVYILNYFRLRFWSYFLVTMLVLQLISDFFVEGLWNSRQLAAFRVCDIYLGLVSLLVLYVAQFHRPKVPGDVKLYHKVLFIFYLFSHLLWSGVVGGIESGTASGMPTYLIGVFSAATLFLVPGSVLLAAMAMSLLSLSLSLHYMQVPLLSVVNQYYTVLILIAIAYITSRLLYATRLRNYISSRQLENINETLDHKVKERTKELSMTNIQLKNEIEIRIRFERELKKALVRAEEADRLKTLFLANMSHEIRTPLNGILGFSDLLKAQHIDMEKMERYIEIIHNSGQQLLKIIDDIMDISMIESNQIKIHKIAFSLNSLLRDTHEFFNTYKKAENRDQLQITYSQGRPDGEDKCYTDPGRLQQVLNNLIKNAVKFTEKGSVLFGYRFSADNIEFYVEDTGIGVRESMRDKLFNHFTQSEEVFKRNYGGTGLGLAISKGIVECMGGSIWLDSTYSPGARFCFSLPHGENESKETQLNAATISTNFSDALKSLGLK